MKTLLQEHMLTTCQAKVNDHNFEHLNKDKVESGFKNSQFYNSILLEV